MWIIAVLSSCMLRVRRKQRYHVSSSLTQALRYLAASAVPETSPLPPPISNPSRLHAPQVVPFFSNLLNTFPCLVTLVRDLIRHARIKTSYHSSTTRGSNAHHTTHRQAFLGARALCGSAGEWTAYLRTASKPPYHDLGRGMRGTLGQGSNCSED